MSKYKIQLDIPEPCTKKFKEMIPAVGGNFCGNCEKVIIDFTHKSDREIANIFKKNNGKICGRFSRQQLNRDIDISFPVVGSYRGKAASLLLSGILTAGISHAQNPSMENIKVQQHQLQEEINHQMAIQKKAISTYLPKMVKFLITDQNNEVLIGASIIITGHPLGTTTDLDGTAILEIPSQIVEEELTFEISYTGYQSQKINVDLNTYNLDLPINVTLRESQNVMGIIVTIGYSNPSTLFQVFKNWYYNLRFGKEYRKDKRRYRKENRLQKRANRKKKKNPQSTVQPPKIIQLHPKEPSVSITNIFPNPLPKRITLELNSTTKGNIQISIFDLTGNKIFRKTQGVTIGIQTFELNLNHVDMGNKEYILHIKEESGQVQTRKIIRNEEGDFEFKN